MKSKTSYGVALCRYNKKNNNNVEIILIKKRYSYAYFSFIFGHYKKSDSKYLKYLFNNMSFSEKVDILGMQFNHMWYRIWLNNPEKHFNLIDMFKHSSKDNMSTAEIYKSYFQKKNKFEKNFASDSGKKLRNIIQQSTDSEIIWEIPKGGRKLTETDIDCAIREFYEETSIKSDKYRICHEIEPITETFTDNDTIYRNVYFLATLRNSSELIPKIDFHNFCQITEVEKVKWVSINEIKFMNLSKKSHKKLINLYTIIIDKFKKYQKIKKLNI